MNTEALLAYIEQPGLLHRVSYQELKTMVLQYPYCQNLRHLLLIKSSQVDHADFERNLQLAATYSLDRTLLFKQMKDSAFKGIFAENNAMPTTLLALQPEDTEELTALPVLNLLTAAAEVPINQGFMSAQDLVKMSGAQRFDDDIDLEDLRAAAIATPKPPKPTNAPSLQDLLLPESAATDIPLEITNVGRVVLTEEDKAYLTPEQAHSFTDWLQQFRTTHPQQLEPTNPPEVTIPDAEVSPVLADANSDDEYTDNDEVSEEYLQVANIVEKSVAFQVFNASETLADLLVIQERYDKAIEVYEQLSLKFPEKSAFFAQKIALLKEANL